MSVLREKGGYTANIEEITEELFREAGGKIEHIF
jgi:hypothetical protein